MSQILENWLVASQEALELMQQERHERLSGLKEAHQTVADVSKNLERVETTLRELAREREVLTSVLDRATTGLSEHQDTLAELEDEMARLCAAMENTTEATPEPALEDMLTRRFPAVSAVAGAINTDVYAVVDDDEDEPFDLTDDAEVIEEPDESLVGVTVVVEDPEAPEAMQATRTKTVPMPTLDAPRPFGANIVPAESGGTMRVAGLAVALFGSMFG